MLTPERCQEIFEKVFKFSEADETEATFGGGENALTRFANNTIHQNVSEEGFFLSVRTVFGKRTGRASTNRYDDESVKQVINQASDITKLAPEDPELLPLLGPQQYQNKNDFYKVTADCTPEQRAKEVGKVFADCQKNNVTAAGYFSTGYSASALGNSKDLFAFYQSSEAGFSATITSPDSTGWVQDSSPNLSNLDISSSASIAIQKALASRNPREIAPGEYTVILEPAAVTDLLVFLMFGFSARQVLEKQSFLTDKVGTKLFGDNITISDDVYHPMQTGTPYDGEGVPRQRLVLIEKGVVQNLCYDRLTAQKMNTRPTGHGFPVPNTFGAAPGNICMSGDNSTLDEMVKSTDRGILVTRFWYNRLVEPIKVTVTGMTRDGTFYIENGKIKYGIKNLRFDESIVDMLNNVVAMGKPVRASGVESPPMVVPPLKVTRFNFQSVTKF